MGEGQDTRDGVGLFFLFRDMVRRKPGEEMAVDVEIIGLRIAIQVSDRAAL